MADDPHSRLAVGQSTLRTHLDALTATTPHDPRFAELAAAVDEEVRAVLEARRDIDAARLRLPTLVIGATAVVGAVVVLVFRFSTWNLLPALLILGVGGAIMINPRLRGDWEPRARTLAGVAAVLGALLTPLVSGWSALVVLAGIGWWAWRWLR